MKQVPMVSNTPFVCSNLYDLGFTNKMNNMYSYFLYGQRLYPLNPSLDEELQRLLGWSPGTIHYSINRNEFLRNGTRDSEFVDENNRDTHGAPGSRGSPNSVYKNSTPMSPMASSTPEPQSPRTSVSDGASCRQSPLGKEGPPQTIRSSIFPSAARRSPRSRCKKLCSFCKNNGERELVYLSHNLKTDAGIILCPVLRNYVCPICQASGDNAHTLKYCPERD